MYVQTPEWVRVIDSITRSKLSILDENTLRKLISKCFIDNNVSPYLINSNTRLGLDREIVRFRRKYANNDDPIVYIWNVKAADRKLFWIKYMHRISKETLILAFAYYLRDRYRHSRDHFLILKNIDSLLKEN